MPCPYCTPSPPSEALRHLRAFPSHGGASCHPAACDPSGPGRFSLSDPKRGPFRMTGSKRIYALDTNVLLHDPTSLFRFEEHDVFIPMTVLEELDEKKKGASEVSRNGRQVRRFLHALIERCNGHGISNGLDLSNPEGVNLNRGGAVGKLYFQQRASNGHGKADNLILSSVIDLRDQHPDRQVILVTKDINLRIKAKINGIDATDN